MRGGAEETTETVLWDGEGPPPPAVPLGRVEESDKGRLGLIPGRVSLGTLKPLAEQVAVSSAGI